MTRDHIKRLAAAAPAATAPTSAPAAPSPSAAAPESAPPVLPPGVRAWYLRVEAEAGPLEYHPHVLAGLEIRYTNARLGVDTSRPLALAAPFCDGAVPVDWDQAMRLGFDASALEAAPMPGAAFGDLPAAGADPKAYDAWRKDVVKWVRRACPLQLWRSERFKLSSRPEETRADFTARLTQAAREQRDLEVEKLRRRYADKFAALRDRLARAEQAVAREEEQLSSKKVDAAISFGTAVLGAFLGRKAVSATSAGRLGTAMKSAGRIKKESGDRERAQENVEAVKARLAELERSLQADIDTLGTVFDPSAEPLQESAIAPTAAGIALEFFGLVWLPYRREGSGGAAPAWKG